MKIFDRFKNRMANCWLLLQRLLISQYIPMLNDDSAQNTLYPPQWREEILRGAVCDALDDISGDFGFDCNNPIPVNGPVGEICYLSKLIMEENDQPLLFHRIGLVNSDNGTKVDIYEYVCWDASQWGFLFLDMYHPVKSKKAPTGFKFFPGEITGLHGINVYVEKFPHNLLKTINKHSKFVLGAALADPFMKHQVDWKKMSPPVLHRQKAEQYRLRVSELIKCESV